MSKQKIDEIKEKVLPIFKKQKILRAAIFGSYALGKTHKNSDVDFLVEFPRGKSLFDLVRLKLSAEEILKKKVDILTYQSLHPLIRENILNQQIKIL